jgi:hypothetical protein
MLRVYKRLINELKVLSFALSADKLMGFLEHWGIVSDDTEPIPPLLDFRVI